MLTLASFLLLLLHWMNPTDIVHHYVAVAELIVCSKILARRSHLQILDNYQQ